MGSESQKILSFGIPCYNSAEYMDRCIESILKGADYADDIEIIVVDDGSSDATPQKADDWERRYPGIIHAVHQENGGHGLAVMKAVEKAHGIYFKNIDSDDWVKPDALAELLELLRAQHEAGDDLDLVITNYVYEHVEDNTRNYVNYKRVLPQNQVFSWNEIGHFKKWQYLLIHTLTYRVEVLRAAKINMPPHTFYVYNIYAYVPFPLCNRLYYLNVDLYRYFIGRDDQSVNEVMLTKRIDHYWRVARCMMYAYHLYDEVVWQRLRSYMMSYFTIVMAICSVFSRMSDREDAMDELQKVWDELKAYDPKMYRAARHGVIGLACNLPGRFGHKVTIAGYRIARKLVKFN